MIAWGGYHTNYGYFADGARYDPATNRWTPLNSSGAPTARSNHTAIWDGTEMIVFGGYDGSNYLGDGGRYDPATDSWTALATTNAPAPRSNHSAVWTGTEMIV